MDTFYIGPVFSFLFYKGNKSTDEIEKRRASIWSNTRPCEPVWLISSDSFIIFFPLLVFELLTSKLSFPSVIICAPLFWSRVRTKLPKAYDWALFVPVTTCSSPPFSRPSSLLPDWLDDFSWPRLRLQFSVPLSLRTGVPSQRTCL